MRACALALLLLLPILAAAPAAHAEALPLDEAAFTAQVAARLRQEVGDDAAVTVKGPLTLGLGELQANLDRIHAFCKRQDGACEVEVQRYVKGAAEVHKDRIAPPRRDAVRLVVRTSAYAQSAAQTTAGGRSPSLQPRPFVDGLVALPVLDSPRTLRMLAGSDNTQLNLSEDEVHALGLANLRTALRPLMEVARPAGPGQIGRVAGDSYDSSRLLLHDSWAPLARAQGGALIVALPATDALFYIGEDTPQAIDALRALVRQVLAQVPNRLSDLLLRWTEGGWAVVR